MAITIGGCLIQLFLRPRPAHRRTFPAPLLLALVAAAGLLHHGSGHPPAGPLDGRLRPVVEEDAAAAIRTGLADRITGRFPERGGMVAALLLAERDGVDRELRDAFRRTGTSHLLAISGFHVGVIAGWLVLALRLIRIGRRGAAGAAAAGIWGYVALLGFPGSATRAATIFTLIAAGRVFGRPTRAVGAWSTALLAIAIARPDEIVAIGTQLSFLGSLGLVLWATPWAASLGRSLRRALRRPEDARAPRIDAFASAAAASAAAQWATLPLAAWSFQQVAVVGLPATLLATPLVSLALPGALLVLAADALRIPGVALPAAGVEALLTLLEWTIRGAARVGPVVHLTPATVAAAVGAGILVPALLRRARHPLGRRGIVAPAVVLGVALLTTPVVRTAEARGAGEGGVEIRFLDVGQGDAALIRTAGGLRILIDTGPPPGDRLVRRLLRLGVARVDLLVLSHPDLDHIGGAAAVVEALPVGAILDPGAVKGGPWGDLVALADRHHVPWRIAAHGDRFEVDGVELRVLAPGPEIPGTGPEAPANDRSLVFELQAAGRRLLFTGDVPRAVERALIPHLDDLDLLKVAHHGSTTSTDPAFLDRIRAEVAVIQVGRRNRFGHPAPVILGRLEGAGAAIWRTDLHGEVRVELPADPRVPLRVIPQWSVPGGPGD